MSLESQPTSGIDEHDAIVQQTVLDPTRSPTDIHQVRPRIRQVLNTDTPPVNYLEPTIHTPTRVRGYSTPSRAVQRLYPTALEIGHGAESVVFHSHKPSLLAILHEGEHPVDPLSGNRTPGNYFSAVTKACEHPVDEDELAREYLRYRERLNVLQRILARDEYLGPAEAKDAVVKVVPSQIPDGDTDHPVLNQRFVPEQSLNRCLQVRGWYAELVRNGDEDPESRLTTPEEQDDYQAITEITLLGQHMDGFNRDKFLDIQGCAQLRTLVRSCDHRPTRKAYVTRLLAGMMAVTTETQELFDTAGFGNMLVFHRGDDLTEHTSRLIDPYFSDEDILTRGWNGLERLRSGETPHLGDLMATINYVNSQRTVRGLALALGMQLPPPPLPPGWTRAEVNFRPLIEAFRTRIPH